jgi:O-antigen/teichoic acid export membrane protein
LSRYWAARRSERGFAQLVARTAGFNVMTTVAGGLSIVVIARAVGPAARGEYAAVTSWFGVVWAIGGMGQPGALCYYVARHPERAADFLATSRAMMLVTGAMTLIAGVLLAPVLGHGSPSVADAYRIAFGSALMAFLATSYVWSLQGRDLHSWNLVWAIQPVFVFIAFFALWRVGRLTLETSLLATSAATVVQLFCAYLACRQVGLVPGRFDRAFVRPLTTYGLAQIAALAPATLNTELDQLVLSQAVPAAALGHYAVAAAVSVIPVPLVAAIGDVAFPRLAAQRTVTADTRRVQRVSVLASFGLSAALMLPLAVGCYWLIPIFFGADYRAAIPILWILAPGTVFLTSGQVAGDLLRGRHQPRVAAWAQSLALVCMVAVLFVLLPVMGIYGAAVASTVAYGIADGIMLYRLSQLPDTSDVDSHPVSGEIIELPASEPEPKASSVT